MSSPNKKESESMIDVIHNIVESYQMNQNMILTKLDSQQTPNTQF